MIPDGRPVAAAGIGERSGSGPADQSADRQG